ncbi:MAG: galactose oxidase-like domain-containing protein [Acidobacteriota bacterium]
MGLGFGHGAVRAQNNVVGTWDAPVSLQVEGVHGAVLPNGKVLYVPHRFNPGGMTSSVVFDPNDPGNARYVTVPENYFCGGHTMLSDGRLLFNGGETLAPNELTGAGYFDYRTETWTVVGAMNRRRWYPSTFQLGDGSIWTFGGQNEAADETSNDPTIESFDVATGQWSMVGGEGIPGQYLEAYNRLHLMPDGKLFQSGHLPATYLYDPVAKTWAFVDNTDLNRARGNGSSVRLQDGRIFIVGGEDKILYFNSAEVIDLTQPNPRWQSVASMSAARAFIDAIVLPDGNVLVLGGDEGTGSALRTPELYDPAANTWTNMAQFQIPRGYHSTTLLLPDGRVIVSGGEGQGGPGIFGESPDYEIWNPYYLFKTPRPVINSLPTEAGYGTQLSMPYTSSVPVSHVVIHRSGSQTHSFSYNQISLPVNFDSNSGSSVTFTVPNNPNLLPPNYYMVFLMSQDGVPSVARWLRIGAGLGDIFADGFEAGNVSAWTAVFP